LVGTDAKHIVRRVTSLLKDEQDYASHQIDVNPYGDGEAAKRIVHLMVERAWTRTKTSGALHNAQMPS
jgi:UDP-N-acetylglucosamine 2-epimerase